jgi:hypothetical protein
MLSRTNLQQTTSTPLSGNEQAFSPRHANSVCVTILRSSARAATAYSSQMDRKKADGSSIGPFPTRLPFDLSRGRQYR